MSYVPSGFRLSFDDHAYEVRVRCWHCPWATSIGSSPSLEEACDAAAEHSCIAYLTVSVLQTALMTALVRSDEGSRAVLMEAMEKIKAALRPFVPDLIDEANRKASDARQD